MKADSITRFQVNGPTGFLEYPKTIKPDQNHIEPLLPTGWQFNADGSISSPDDLLAERTGQKERRNSINNEDGIAPMLPILPNENRV